MKKIRKMICIATITLMACFACTACGTTYQEAVDNKYKRRMFGVINSSSDEKLIELNKEFYNGIEFDRRLGKKVSKVTIEIDGLINEEMRKRGLKTCDDIEEDIWFSQHR